MTLSESRLIKVYENIDHLGFKCIVEYDEITNNYLVEVTYSGCIKTEEFLAFNVPIYGIDLADLAKAQEIAERLAKEIEEELNAS